MNLRPAGLILDDPNQHGGVAAVLVVPGIEHGTLFGLPVTLVGVEPVAHLILSSN